MHIPRKRPGEKERTWNIMQGKVVMIKKAVKLDKEKGTPVHFSLFLLDLAMKG